MIHNYEVMSSISFVMSFLIFYKVYIQYIYVCVRVRVCVCVCVCVCV